MAAFVAIVGVSTPLLAQQSQALVDGYEDIVNQRWASAEANLDKALEADRDNPYVLLNLGVVYQQTGRDAQAREMYNRVIESGTSAIAGRSNLPRERGRALVRLAEDNLSRLDGNF
jgi:tetratricopeptide (TPR) repeat protein